MEPVPSTLTECTKRVTTKEDVVREVEGYSSGTFFLLLSNLGNKNRNYRFLSRVRIFGFSWTFPANFSPKYFGTASVSSFKTRRSSQQTQLFLVLPPTISINNGMCLRDTLGAIRIWWRILARQTWRAPVNENPRQRKWTIFQISTDCTVLSCTVPASSARFFKRSTRCSFFSSRNWTLTDSGNTKQEMIRDEKMMDCVGAG
jgi:hypothetical protein